MHSDLNTFKRESVDAQLKLIMKQFPVVRHLISRKRFLVGEQVYRKIADHHIELINMFESGDVKDEEALLESKMKLAKFRNEIQSLLPKGLIIK